MARRDLLLLHGILPSRRRGCETRDRKPSLFNFFASFFLPFSFEQREIKNINDAKIWNNISMRKFFDKNVPLYLRLIPKSLHRYLQTDQRFRNNRLFPDMAFPLSSLCFSLLLLPIRLPAEIVAVAQYDRSVARRSYRVFTKYVEDSNDIGCIYTTLIIILRNVARMREQKSWREIGVYRIQAGIRFTSNTFYIAVNFKNYHKIGVIYRNDASNAFR